MAEIAGVFRHEGLISCAEFAKAAEQRAIAALSPPSPEAAPQVATDHCQCFGESGLHASTHGDSNGRVLCNLCGLPVQDGSIDALTAINTPSPAAPAEADTLAARSTTNTGDRDDG